MKKFLNKVFLSMLSMLLSLSIVVVPSFAKGDVHVMSGGSVKTEYKAMSYKKVGETWSYKWLENEWHKNRDQYTVKAEKKIHFSVHLENESSVGVKIAGVAEPYVKSKNRGIVASFSYTLKKNSHYTMNPKNYNRLRMKVKVNIYECKVKAIATTYDTATGYKTTEYNINEKIKMLNSNEKYVYMATK